MKLKYKIATGALAAALVGGGCAGINMLGSKDAETYLSDKYKIEFKAVDSVDDSKESEYKAYCFKDENDRQLEVREAEDNNFSDNYGAFLFDNDSQIAIQTFFGDDYKVFVSTKNQFFGSEEAFTGYAEYTKACDFVRISILVTHNDDKDVNLDAIAKLLSDYNKDKGIEFQALVAVVSPEGFESISNYDHIPSEYIVAVDSFSLTRENQLSKASWERG